MKGREMDKLTGKGWARKQRHIALGWNAKWKREQYARQKAYIDEVYG